MLPGSSARVQAGSPVKLKSSSMEYICCNLCGADDSELLFTSPDRMFHKNVMFNVVRCKRCGLIYTNPRPTPEHINDFYPTEEYLPFTNFRNPILRLIKQAMVRHHVQGMRKLTGSKARILEVGCGTGEYLSGLRDWGGWDVVGVELSPHASKIARERFGLDIITGTLFDAALPPKAFDIVLMRYVLEHIHNPRETLIEINKLLRDKGKFICCSPNVDSLEASVLGKYWGGLDIPRHLYHFSPKTLGKLLQSAGLQICRISYSPLPNDWVWSLRYIVEANGSPACLTRTMNAGNILWLALFAPPSTALALIRQSGRIKIIAERSAVT